MPIFVCVNLFALVHAHVSPVFACACALFVRPCIVLNSINADLFAETKNSDKVWRQHNLLGSNNLIEDVKFVSRAHEKVANRFYVNI